MSVDMQHQLQQSGNYSRAHNNTFRYVFNSFFVICTGISVNLLAIATLMPDTEDASAPPSPSSASALALPPNLLSSMSVVSVTTYTNINTHILT